MNSPERPGIYIHVPFCRSKCPYCDFYSVTSLSLVREWKEALFKEIEIYKDRCSAFDTLYLGGGTPSVLGDRDLTDLFDRLFERFHFHADSEITFEANPDDITKDKLKILRTVGVNRISLGVQSLDDDELRSLGRRHTAEQGASAIETIRGGGFSNLSVDLMYGLPGRRPSHWMRTLGRILEHRPEHISCYQLTFYGATPFGRMCSEGQMSPPAEETQRTLFMMTADRLVKSGYSHYEVSNFAREPDRISRHNCKYWRRAPYLGFGPGAHSFHRETRWWNERSILNYCKNLREGRLPIEGSEHLTEEQQRLETLSLGFRTREGVELPILQAWPGYEKALAGLESGELVEIRDGRVVPTTKGYVVADSLPLFFL